MKKIFLVMVILFCLFGCYQKINHAEIEKAKQFCEDKGGIDYIRESWEGATCIYCLDGSSAYDISIKVKK